MIMKIAIAAATLACSVLTVQAEERSGSFEGRSDHITTGEVKIVQTEAGAVVLLANNFSLDGAPDPKVGFGSDGKFDGATILGALRSINGLQAYAVPEGIDPANFNEVYIWCKKFSVPLGVATMN